MDSLQRSSENEELRDKIITLRAVLMTKSWFAFDLDDTLHEFRRASRKASSATLSMISDTYSIPVLELKARYTLVQAQKTSSAFVEGRMSYEYREDRFRSVLERFGIDVSAELMQSLLQTYETVLTSFIKLKPAALGLLTILRSQDKKIAVITEGSQDAQERTIRALGLDSLVDFLATTNNFGVSKTTGLFPKVLEHLNIEPEDMVMIGDNYERDMRPTMGIGIFGIHLVENEEPSLDSEPVKINTLRMLEQIIAAE